MARRRWKGRSRFCAQAGKNLMGIGAALMSNRNETRLSSWQLRSSLNEGCRNHRK